MQPPTNLSESQEGKSLSTLPKLPEDSTNLNRAAPLIRSSQPTAYPQLASLISGPRQDSPSGDLSSSYVITAMASNAQMLHQLREMRLLTPFIRQFGALVTDLDLSGHSLETAALLVRHCPGTKKLSFAGHEQLSDSVLLKMVRGCPKLEQLNLSHCVALSDEALLQLPCLCPKLHTLDLTVCNMSKKTVSTLRLGTPPKVPALTVIGGAAHKLKEAAHPDRRSSPPLSLSALRLTSQAEGHLSSVLAPPGDKAAVCPPPHLDLQRRLQALLGGKSDQLGEAIAKLQAALTSPKLNRASALESLHALLPTLKLPSELIPPAKRSSVINGKGSRTSDAFKAIRQRIAKLEVILSQLEEVSALASVIEGIKAIVAVYQVFVTGMCEGNARQRKAMLAPKARICGDLIGCYLIDVELARKILCCDRYGCKKRENTYGNHPVTAIGGIHFKANLGLDPISPAKEYAAASFYNLICPEQVPPRYLPFAAPTAFLKISEVPIDAIQSGHQNAKEIAAYQSQLEGIGLIREGKIGGVVQAGYTIGWTTKKLPKAISFRDLLALIDLLGALRGRLGVTTLVEQLPSLSNAKGGSASASQLAKRYLEFMKKWPSKKRCLQFRDPADAPSSEQGGYVNLLSKPHKELVEEFRRQLEKAPAKDWLALLHILKTHPQLMEGRPLHKLIEIPRLLRWIPKLMPTSSPEEVINELPFILQRLDHKSFSGLCLASLLTNPEDGKADNYMIAIERDIDGHIVKLHPVGIDNDCAFGGAIAPFGQSKAGHYVASKCLLYGLKPLMSRAVHDDVRKAFLTRTPEEMMLAWIEGLAKRRIIYWRLEKEGVLTTHDLANLSDEHQRGIEKKKSCASSKVDVLFTLPRGALRAVYRKLRRAHSLLKRNPKASHNQLFEALEPLLFHCYRGLLKEVLSDQFDPLAVQHALYKELHLSVETLCAHILWQTLDFDPGSQTIGAYLRQGVEPLPNFPLAKEVESFLDELDWSGDPPPLQRLERIASWSLLERLPKGAPNSQQLLEKAIVNELPHLAQLCLRSGASISCKNTHEETPLHLFARTTRTTRALEMAQMLIEPGLDFTLRDAGGQTPVSLLLDSRLNRSSRLTRQLLAHFTHCGANLDIATSRGETLLDWAIDQDAPSLFVNLINQGAGRDVDPKKALGFYRRHPEVEEAFAKLQRQSRRVAWLTTIEEVTCPKGDVFQTAYSKLQTAAQKLSSLRPLLARLKSPKQLISTAQRPALLKSRLGATHPAFQAISQSIKQIEQFQARLGDTADRKARQLLEQLIEAYHTFIAAFCKATPAQRKLLLAGHYPLESASLGRLFLKPELTLQLCLDRHGHLPPKGQGEYGRRRGRPTHLKDHHIYFKENPEMAGVEYAAHSLIRRTIGHGVAQTELFKARDAYGQPFPLLASQFIEGGNLEDLFNSGKARHKLDRLDPHRLHNRILMAMLLDPEDDRPDNYIIAPLPKQEGRERYELICIDNDHAFVNPITTDWRGCSQLQTRCILYCLDQMNDSVHRRTKELFLRLDPLTLLKEWLGELQEQEGRYLSLFNEKERKWLAAKEKDNPIVITIPFPQGSIARIYERLLRMKRALRAEPNLSLMRLLRLTIPLVGAHYEAAFVAAPTPPKRFDHLFSTALSRALGGRWGPKTTSSQILALRGIPINTSAHATGPKKALNELRQIGWQSKRIVHCKEQLLAQNPRPFLNLLIDPLRERVISTIDFAKHPKAQKIVLWSILQTHPAFSRLSLRNCRILTDGTLGEILLAAPGIRQLNLSGCTKLTRATLATLAGDYPHLEVLDLSGWTQLETLTGLHFPKLRRFSLGRCTRLKQLQISAPRLTHLTLGGCRALTHVEVYQSPPAALAFWQDPPSPAKQLERINLTSCGRLTKNQVARMIKSSPHLRVLIVKGCPQIAKQEHWPLIRQCPHLLLHFLELYNSSSTLTSSQFEALAAAVNPTAPTLDLAHKQLGTKGAKALALVLTHSTLLTSLNLRSNQIGNEGAKWLSAALSKNLNLKHFDLGNNELGRQGAQRLSTAIAQSSTLISLHLQDNKIDDAGVSALGDALSKNPSLMSLSLRNNCIGKVGVIALGRALANNTTLTRLGLEGNQIGIEEAKALGVALRRNTTLTGLSLEYSYVSAKEAGALGTAVTKNSALTRLDLTGSKIGDQGARALGTVLETHSALATLKLPKNGIGTAGAIALSKGLASNRVLAILDLSDNKIASSGAKALGAALLNNSALTRVNLRRNGIGRVGAQVLAKALAKNDTLTALSLEHNAIGNEAAKAFGTALAKNHALTDLNLQRNSIGKEGVEAISTAIAKMQTLTSLNLGGNRLFSRGAVALASALAHNKVLTNLELEHSNIGNKGAKVLGTTLINNDSLTSLSLLGNQIGSQSANVIATLVAKNNALTDLNLSNNRLDDEGAKAISAALGNNNTLTSLELASIDVGERGVTSIGVALSSNQTLTRLDLGHNRINAKAAKALGNALTENSTLRELKLCHNNLGYGGAKALLEACSKNNALTSLSLENNLISRWEAATLGAYLSANATLTELSLEHNYVGTMEARTIGAAIASNSALTHLDLKGAGIGAEGTRMLQPALESHSTLTNLNLHYNDLGDEGASAVAHILAKNSAIQVLDLQRNRISDVGVRAISDGLSSNRALRCLDLGYNRVIHEGMEALGNLLAKNCTLTSLNLSGNPISNKGMAALSTGLTQNHTLKRLSLKCTTADDRAADLLGTALTHNMTLATLNLGRNEIGPSGVKALGQALTKNRTLTVLNLRHNQIDQEGARVLAFALASNCGLTELNLNYNSIGEGKASNEQGTTNQRTYQTATRGVWARSRHSSPGSFDAKRGAVALGASLAKNRHLNTLHLKHSHVGVEGTKTLGTALRNNRTLTSLDLSHNDIGDEEAKVLVNALIQNRTLTSLNLGHNGHRRDSFNETAKAFGVTLISNYTLTSLELSHIPNLGSSGGDALGRAFSKNYSLKLKHLGLSETGISLTKNLGTSPSDLHHLTSLDLSRNRLYSFEAWRKVALTLSNMTNLTRLNLGGNGIKDVGAPHLSSALGKMQALRDLNLAHNGIGQAGKVEKRGARYYKYRGKGARWLGSSLATTTALTSLKLQGNKIGPEGAKTLGAALANGRALTHLDLSGNEIGGGVYAIAAGLSGHFALTSLQLNGLRTSWWEQGHFGNEGAKALAATLANKGALASLSLSRTGIRRQGAAALAKALANCRALEDLDLSDNSFGPEGAESLAAALSNNRTLTSLNLQHTLIEDKGITAIATALTNNRFLTYLNLRTCRIDDAGAKAIGLALVKGGSLTHLDLGSNKIGNAGARALGSALTHNSSLTALNLKQNRLGSIGARALASALSSHTALRELCLANNQIGNWGAIAMSSALAKPTPLRRLDMSRNRIYDEGAKAFRAALLKRRSTLLVLLADNDIKGSYPLPRLDQPPLRSAFRR